LLFWQEFHGEAMRQALDPVSGSGLLAHHRDIEEETDEDEPQHPPCHLQTEFQ
jgi:hypothetical protein